MTASDRLIRWILFLRAGGPSTHVPGIHVWETGTAEQEKGVGGWVRPGGGIWGDIESGASS